ncbi:MAG: chromosome segregation protein SMC, partial [Gammaproteobacteria bacterium]
MRLSKVRLAGFKSFVDPTTINLPSNLIGIIGPNGCGKSNVIDAVRWVMGETSAKHLRGDSMADVIFNGSTGRKPVGLASIELVFDNSDGAVGGQYAGFNEISVKRAVSRDGTSSYYLNGTRCRRRDITDIFLGTGLGPRSYAIIEQGMISRLIEAKPEELRVFLEEAAGISKYKERRRETENRIRHTKENIERLNDLRDEIEKHLQHLQRQARTAERYKEFKNEERRLRAELLALRCAAMDTELAGKDRVLGERETALQAAIAELRAVESSLEKTRERHTEANDGFNEVQGRFYSVGADIARIEQAIQHARDTRQRQERDLEQAEHAFGEIQGHIERDREQLEDMARSLAELEPGLARAREAESASAQALQGAEESMQAWQSRWESFTEQASGTSQSTQVARTQIEHIERQLQQALQRRDRLLEEREQLSTSQLDAELQELEGHEREARAQRERLQQELDAALDELKQLRDQDRELSARLHELRSHLQDGRGRLSSLEALQQAALARGGEGGRRWLEEQGLQDNRRLAETVRVASGWELAVETVLGFHLQAVCVEELDSLAEAAGALQEGAVALVDGRSSGAAGGDGERLSSRVEAPFSLDSLLGSVRLARSLEEALALRGQLGPGESLITPDGVWLGANWIRVNREQDERAGVLAREQEIKRLSGEQAELEREIEELGGRHDEARDRIRSLEERREELQAEVNRAHRRHTELGSLMQTRQSRREQLTRRFEEVTAEVEELAGQVEAHQTDLKAARGRLEEAMASLETSERRREELNQERDAQRRRLEEARAQARQDRDLAHELALKVESRRTIRESTQRNLERMQSQLEQLETRRRDLREALESGVDPLAGQQQELNELLERRSQVEAELGEARRHLEALDEELRHLERGRVEKEGHSQELRGELEQLRLGSQELRVRRQTVFEQLQESGFELAALKSELPEEASIGDWEERLEKLEQRIQRLGPINLAAIDEFEEESR